MDALVSSRRRTGPPRGVARLGVVGDAWFQALDRSVLTVGRDTFSVHVLGVHVDRDHVWLQLAAAHDPLVSFVVRVEPTTTLGDVHLALAALPSAPQPLEVVYVLAREAFRS
jgi:hypothetical protein